MNNRTGTNEQAAPRPELGPESGPVAVPTAAKALGISERAVRKRIQAGTLRAKPFGRTFMVWLPDDAPQYATAEQPAKAPGPEPQPEPIEAYFTTTPAQVERAIEATASRYAVDFAALYDRMSADMGARYEQTIAAKDALITELRRRAEAAEAELARQNAAPRPPETPQQKEITQTPDAAAPPRRVGGMWARLWRDIMGV